MSVVCLAGYRSILLACKEILFQDMKLIGKVSEITLYPIKSCAGFSVSSGLCTKLGLQVNGCTDR